MTLEEALSLNKDQISALREDLDKKSLAQKDLGAFIEQFEGKPLSSLGEGIPVAIKDNICVKNWPLTCASRILQGYVSPYNATAIDNLQKAGFSPFGRTNMDEFAMGSTGASSFYGRTLNPSNKALIPGGSSSGSAAAVAGGLAIAALGSDTGGSVRQPAAFCGCVGFKPSYGRVSRYGLAAYSSSLDQIGVLTQNVRDAALLYDAISSHDEKDSTSANISYIKTHPALNADKKLVIGVAKNYISSCDLEVRDGLQSAISSLKAAGHEIKEIQMSDAKYDVAAYYIIAAAEASTNLSRYDGVRYGFRSKDFTNLNEMYSNTRTQGFGEEVKRRILLGTFVLSSGYYDAYYLLAVRARCLVKKRYDELLADVDVLFSPIAPTLAYEFDTPKSLSQVYLEDAYSIGANMAGLPAITIPVAKANDGRNISAQLLCKRYDEQGLLDAAFILENIIKEKK